jgi:hypothetical protein
MARLVGRRMKGTSCWPFILRCQHCSALCRMSEQVRKNTEWREDVSSKCCTQHSSNCRSACSQACSRSCKWTKWRSWSCCTSYSESHPTYCILHLLWGEYEQGIGGRKAARLFSREERGTTKHKYHRREVVWDCIAELAVRAGFTPEVAIDRVY